MIVIRFVQDLNNIYYFLYEEYYKNPPRRESLYSDILELVNKNIADGEKEALVGSV
jgi:hypothetical protein